MAGIQLQESEVVNEDEAVEIETLAEDRTKKKTVNVVASHVGITEGLRPLNGIKTAVRSKTQNTSGGPRNGSERSLKDVTNKSDYRPTIAKTSKPITKTSATQQKENIKILKRIEKVWRAEPVNGAQVTNPIEASRGGLRGQATVPSGSRPPDPPDPNITTNEPSGSPNTLCHRENLGAIGAVAEGIDPNRREDVQSSSGGDVSMEKASVGSMEAEVVRSTKF